MARAPGVRTLAHLSRMTGIAIPNLSAYANGRRVPDADNRRRIAFAIGQPEAAAQEYWLVRAEEQTDAGTGHN